MTNAERRPATAMSKISVTQVKHDTYGEADYPCSIYTVTVGSVTAEVWLDDEEGRNHLDGCEWMGSFGDYLTRDPNFDTVIIQVGEVLITPDELVKACESYSAFADQRQEGGS